jgi:hypothetical protein
MAIEDTVLEKLRALPPERQQEVLEFVEALAAGVARRRPRRSAEGLWAELGVTVTDGDIAQARRELWGGFPREFPSEGG